MRAFEGEENEPGLVVTRVQKSHLQNVRKREHESV
ncbi:hypothetical protein Bcell_3673 [Evansella cellulosilytica DSM 2522]|uniref:Uncharacterized protein n=1 Tax=Evansella cellulosilytica (strain ATCC 21833 / DSM 2522 / FERM P-1141 / JCM 9156 / N-4) TaxID=649639 RepID=E6TT06_EVAC2|nr:hypothetical protein Bcell_3673 [Evansella cellulosilytica DSM 2522]